MGVVYEAEQDRPRRHVALKVLRPGLLTPAMLRRFEHECPSVLVALGAALLAQGKVDEALTHVREANTLYEKLNPRTRSFVKLEAKSLLGAALAKKGNLKEGQPLMSDAAR